MKKIFYVVIVLILIFIIFCHPLIHLKYWYQQITKTSTEHLSIGTGYYRKTENDYDNYYSSTDYFSKEYNDNDINSFDISYFENNGLLYIEFLLYDSLKPISVFLNDKKIQSRIDTDYYNIFSEKFYIVKTIRIWIFQDDLILNKDNNLSLIIGENIYNYYFKITKKSSWELYKEKIENTEY